MNDAYAEELVALMPQVRSVVARFAARSDWDDLTQEWAARLLTKEGLYRPRKGPLTAWALTAARNVARNQRRRPVDQSLPQEPVAAENTSEVAIDEERIDWLLEQLGRLNDDERKILSLRYNEGLDNESIGNRLAISPSAASRRIHQVLGRLKHRARIQGLVARVLPISWAAGFASSAKAQATAAVVIAATTVGVTAMAFGFFLPAQDTQLVTSTSELKTTDFALALAQPFDPRRNTLWASSLPLAWKAIQERLGQPVDAAGWPAAIQALQREAQAPRGIHPRSYVAGAGYLRDDLVESLQDRLEDTFGRGRDPVLDDWVRQWSPDSFLAYAFVAKDLPFRYAFDSLDYAGLQFHTAGKEEPRLVQGFGMRSYDPDNPTEKEQASQIEVHHYAGRENFVFSIVPDAKGQRIVLARIPPEATLEATIARALKAMESESKRLNSHDRVAVPKFDLHLTHQFAETRGKSFRGDDGELVPLDAMQQTLHFKMDERGAIVRMRSMVGSLSAAPDPRRLVCDGPFLLLLTDAHSGKPAPVMAAWIANPELLLPFVKPAK